MVCVNQRMTQRHQPHNNKWTDVSLGSFWDEILNWKLKTENWTKKEYNEYEYRQKMNSCPFIIPSFSKRKMWFWWGKMNWESVVSPYHQKHSSQNFFEIGKDAISTYYISFCIRYIVQYTFMFNVHSHKSHWNWKKTVISQHHNSTRVQLTRALRFFSNFNLFLCSMFIFWWTRIQHKE